MADKLRLFPIDFARLPYREISFDKNNTLKQDIKIPGNKHISTDTLTKWQAIHVKISVKMCPFTMKVIASLNVLFGLKNFAQYVESTAVIGGE